MIIYKYLHCHVTKSLMVFQEIVHCCSLKISIQTSLIQPQSFDKGKGCLQHSQCLKSGNFIFEKLMVRGCGEIASFVGEQVRREE
uniref:Uncharacterized protein n=1 Tax=Vitis vinifera TaxID=29760 RepID=F6HVE0_VITVI